MPAAVSSNWGRSYFVLLALSRAMLRRMRFGGEIILAELRAALREHIQFTRQLTAATLNWDTAGNTHSKPTGKLEE